MPFLPGLLAWTLLNALAVAMAVRRLFRGRDGTAAMVIVFPALIAAVQSTSSNGLIGALMVAGFLAMERAAPFRAGAAIALATLMKLFPAALLPFVVMRRDRRRFVLSILAVFALFVLSPLLIAPDGTLQAQYASWAAILRADEADLTFARSIMVVLRNVVTAAAPNWLFQAAGVALLVTPLALRPGAWSDSAFRRSMLASVLIFVVIFNHQSENASYVIAAIGLAIWFLQKPRSLARWVLLVACMAGLEAVPYFIVWLWLQYELVDGQRMFGAMAEVLAAVGVRRRTIRARARRRLHEAA